MRLDIYNGIHKAQRAFVTETLLMIDSVDARGGSEFERTHAHGRATARGFVVQGVPHA